MSPLDLLLIGAALILAALVALPLLLVLGVTLIVLSLVRLAWGERL